MDFLQNPFYILDVTPQDNRRRIMEQADTRSLFRDPEECRTAATALTNPRRRLYAEIAWLPMSSQKHADEILALLASSLQDSSVFSHSGKFQLAQVRDCLSLDEQMPISRTNLLVAGLGRLLNPSSDWVATWIFDIASASADINPAPVRATINAARNVAGFSPVQLSDTEAEIQKLQDYYCRVMTSALDSLSGTQRPSAMTGVVKLAANDVHHIPRLINRLIDLYEKDAQKSLKEHESRIGELVGKLRAASDADRPDSALVSLIDQLIQAVKNWDAIAQPIQLNRKSQGRFHDASVDVARRVRESALHLWNEHGKLDFCQQLINMLREVFAEVSEVVAIIEEDIKSLDDIAMQHAHLTSGVKQFESIKAQVQKLQAAADAKKSDSLMNSMAADLIRHVNRWDAALQPIEANTAVTNLVRGLALHLWNEHGQLDISLQLTKTLQRVFADVGEISDRLEEDNKTLSQLVQQRARILKTSGQESAGGGYGCLWTLGIFIAIGLLGALFENC